MAPCALDEIQAFLCAVVSGPVAGGAGRLAGRNLGGGEGSQERRRRSLAAAPLRDEIVFDLGNQDCVAPIPLSARGGSDEDDYAAWADAYVYGLRPAGVTGSNSPATTATTWPNCWNRYSSSTVPLREDVGQRRALVFPPRKPGWSPRCGRNRRTSCRPLYDFLAPGGHRHRAPGKIPGRPQRSLPPAVAVASSNSAAGRPDRLN